MFKNELCHKIHEIHQQNIKNLRINKTKFRFKNNFLHGHLFDFFAFGLFGAFEHEAREFQEKPIEIFFAHLIGGAKKLHLAFNFWCQKLEAKHIFLFGLPMFCKTKEIFALASDV
jgi:hypothetical protein